MGWPPRGGRRAGQAGPGAGLGGPPLHRAGGKAAAASESKAPGLSLPAPYASSETPAALHPPRQRPFPEGDAAPSSHRGRPQFTFLSRLAWPQRRRTQPHPRRQKTPALSHEASQHLQGAVPRASHGHRGGARCHQHAPPNLRHRRGTRLQNFIQSLSFPKFTGPKDAQHPEVQTQGAAPVWLRHPKPRSCSNCRNRILTSSSSTRWEWLDLMILKDFSSHSMIFDRRDTKSLLQTLHSGDACLEKTSPSLLSSYTGGAQTTREQTALGKRRPCSAEGAQLPAPCGTRGPPAKTQAQVALGSCCSRPHASQPLD